MQCGADLIHFKASSSNNIARFNELLRVASSRNTRSRSSDVDNHHRTAAACVNVESDLVNASIKKCLFSATGAIRRLEFLLANPRVKDNLRANAMKIVRVRMHQRMTVSRKMQMDASLCTRTKLLLQTKRRLYHQTKTTKEMGETKRNEDINRLESTLEDLRRKLELAEGKAREEIERIDEDVLATTTNSSVFVSQRKCTTTA